MKLWVIFFCRSCFQANSALSYDIDWVFCHAVWWEDCVNAVTHEFLSCLCFVVDISRHLRKAPYKKCETWKNEFQMRFYIQCENRIEWCMLSNCFSYVQVVIIQRMFMRRVKEYRNLFPIRKSRLLKKKPDIIFCSVFFALGLVRFVFLRSEVNFLRSRFQLLLWFHFARYILSFYLFYLQQSTLKVWQKKLPSSLSVAGCFGSSVNGWSLR